jgi:aquaporin Z
LIILLPAGFIASARALTFVRPARGTPRTPFFFLIIEFVGTVVLVTVAAGSGAINHYAGGGPISRTAAAITPGAVVMAMI